MTILEKIEKLGTIAECDALLLSMAKDQSDAEAAIYELNQKIKNILEVGQDTKFQHLRSTTELEVITTVRENAPNEKVRASFDGQFKTLDLRVFRLNERLRNYGDVAEIEVSFDIRINEMIIAEITSLIPAVQARKTALENQAA